ncbi:Histidinol-phosphate aminotransferase [Posidoniimonas polymericola]|uniref:Histidinol-phosphate aminotransferase n=1 Tax=Posidoniimonas polymericola TaxID=2528002 RepID=A0A5C5YSM0_9BACT|nr:histidinol-phosphate transaminase [Posidoniimonas polymericola]TWT77949.1 Histidinol-phosphate aminotransferase [Posidoniimonas polymericola]
MNYARPDIQAMTGYTPGEQPKGTKVIKLNTNENPYPASPKVTEAITRAAQAGLQKYPDASGTAFRMRAGDVLGVDPDWILCGNGSDDILTIATRTFVGENDAVRYATPSYVLYKTLAEIQGAVQDVVRYERDWTLGYEFVAPAERLKLAYLANPNSPSGTVLQPGEVAAIADALPCPLLVDEAYVDFADSNCLDLVRTNERVMVSRTLSKSYALAGLRFGYVVAQPAIIEQMAKVKDSYNCDALAIAGATAAIDDQAWLVENVAKVRATRGRLAAALGELGFAVTDSQANFVWAVHPTLSHEELYLDLKSQGVLVRYMRYDHWGDGLRVSVGADEQIDALLALLAPLVRGR